VTVKNARRLVIFTNKCIKAEGKADRRIYDNGKNLMGQIEIKITITLFGRIEP